jgi:hypothetical protein
MCAAGLPEAEMSTSQRFKLKQSSTHPSRRQSSRQDDAPSLVEMDTLPHEQWPSRDCDSNTSETSDSVHQRKQLAREKRMRGCGLATDAAVQHLDALLVATSPQHAKVCLHDAVLAVTCRVTCSDVAFYSPSSLQSPATPHPSCTKRASPHRGSTDVL